MFCIPFVLTNSKVFNYFKIRSSSYCKCTFFIIIFPVRKLKNFGIKHQINIRCKKCFLLGMKFPTTPPPKRKHTTGNAPTLILDSYPLTKSKSHESQLAASKGEKDVSPSK